jgi:hypothetical protein
MMVAKSRRWTWNRFTWICILAILGSQSAEASKLSPQLKPGSICKLQGKLNIRDKAQRKNIKITRLARGDTFEIVRYHRVWVRIRINGNIAFATPQAVKNLCALEAPDTKTAQTEAEPSGSPATSPKKSDPAVQVPEQAAKDQPAQSPTAEPAPQAKKPSAVNILPIQVPDLGPTDIQTEAHLSPAAWVALGTGALSLGAAAFFVTQLTKQDEATTGQYALLTGTAGIMAVVVGLSYILYPEKSPKRPIAEPEKAVSTQILLGPNSIGLAGQF